MHAVGCQEVPCRAPEGLVAVVAAQEQVHVQKAQPTVQRGKEQAVDEGVEELGAHDLQRGVGGHEDQIRAAALQLPGVRGHAPHEHIHRHRVGAQHHQQHGDEQVIFLVQEKRGQEVGFQPGGQPQQRHQRGQGLAELILDQLQHRLPPPFPQGRRFSGTGRSACPRQPIPPDRPCAPARRFSCRWQRRYAPPARPPDGWR